MAEERAWTAAELFDAIGSGYQDAFGSPPVVAAGLRLLLDRLPDGAAVLDIGSGTGSPVAAGLAAAGHAVTGLDVSPVMLEIARRQVPGAEFVLADVRTWHAEPASWDAVCAFFPFLQLSRAETVTVLERIAGWLRPGGTLALVTVPMDVEDLPVEFLGHPVRITSFTADDLLARVAATGLRVVHRAAELFQPDKPGAQAEEHLLVIAERPGPGAPSG